MQPQSLSLTVKDADVRLSYLRRPGTAAPLVCLHGFGSSKEDYADLALRPEFMDRDLVLFDAPGCGASEIADYSVLSIAFLIETVIAATDALGLEKFHLVGHSMGGLTALLFANRFQDRVLSFFDIEGNVAPEDCFLSRQIIEHPASTANGFLDGLITRVRDLPEYACGLYASTLPWKVRARSVEPIFRSMVEISDEAPLMEFMAGLRCPKAFVHGAQNGHLSYLPSLPDIGVKVIEIAHSGHFPMYSNPVALWIELAVFLDEAEAAA